MKSPASDISGSATLVQKESPVTLFSNSDVTVFSESCVRNSFIEHLQCSVTVMLACRQCQCHVNIRPPLSVFLTVMLEKIVPVSFINFVFQM